MKNYIGSFLGHYKVLGKLGSGAMSEVYLGYDEDLQIHVAVKVLTDAILSRPELVQRFKIEARAAARLNHPNIAHVYYFNFKGDTPFFAMELVEGVSLADVLERRLRFTLRQYLDIFSQSVRGLRAAAVRGIIHRDIKPGNLMVGRDGLAKVVDFGLAKVGDEKGLTQTGTMMGTPYYLSPEAVRGEELDLRCDIYSLGVTMFQVLVGYPPFDSDTPFGVMMQHINTPAPDAWDYNDQFPRALCRFIERAMAKERTARFANHEAVLNALSLVTKGLSNRVLNEEIAFCGVCDVNTFTRGDHCSRCRNPYVGQEEPETYYDLYLTGFRDQQGEEKAAAYISEAVGRRIEVVRRTITTLPFKIGHRLAYERAKKMQRRFYELGGDVELRRLADGQTGPETERLEFVSAAAARTASFVAPSPARDLTGNPVRKQRMLIGVLAAVLVGLAGLLLWQTNRARTWDRSEVDEPDGPDVGATMAAVESQEEAPTQEASAEREPEKLLPLALTVEGDIDPETVAAVEAAIEAAATVFGETCSWSPERPQSLVIDPYQAFRRDDDPRAWEESMGRPVGEFPAGGLTADDRALKVAAGHWVARSAVADLAGGDAPAWVPLGLAFYQEARSLGLDREPFIELSKETNHIPLIYWGATPGRNPPGNIARAESMVEYLVERGGPRGFARFLAALRSQTLEDALDEVYGIPAAEVQAGWEMFLRTRYLGMLAP